MPDYAALGMEDFLRARGAKPDLISLLWQGDYDAVKELLEHDPEAVLARGPDDIPAIVFSGSLPMAQLLVDHGADLITPFTTPRGLTNPIRCFANWWANNFGGLDLLRFFLKSAQIPEDIFTATVLGDVRQVEEMMEKDPSLVNSVSGSDYILEPGFTALHYAAQFGRIEIAQILIDRRADINASSPVSKGETPLHVAVRLGHRIAPQ